MAEEFADHAMECIPESLFRDNSLELNKLFLELERRLKKLKNIQGPLKEMNFNKSTLRENRKMDQ